MKTKLAIISRWGASKLTQALWMGLVVISAASGGKAASPLISAGEAEKFCLEQWFPDLRIGHVPSAGELNDKLDILLKHYTDEIEIIDPNNKDFFGVDVLKGKSEIRRYYSSILGTYPLWRFKILKLYPTAEGFILQYLGENAGPVSSFEGIDIVELKKIGKEWKITKLTEYYDRLPFSKGAAP